MVRGGAISILKLFRIVVMEYGFERKCMWAKCCTITYVTLYFTPNEPMIDFKQNFSV